MPLTDVAIRNTRPSGRTQKLWDGGGLHLVIARSGSRHWRLKYRVDGREKTLSIGPYPSIGLKAARRARDEAKALLAAGIDPSAEKRARAAGEGEGPAPATFADVADEHLALLRREERAPATLLKAEWLLGMAKEGIGARPIREITAPEVLEVLRRVEARGTYETARRLRSIISRVFRHAVATGHADGDPTFALRGALVRPRATSRAAITDLQGLRRLYAQVDAYGGQLTTRGALKLMALLVPRPGGTAPRPVGGVRPREARLGGAG